MYFVVLNMFLRLNLYFLNLLILNFIQIKIIHLFSWVVADFRNNNLFGFQKYFKPFFPNIYINDLNSGLNSMLFSLHGDQSSHQSVLFFILFTPLLSFFLLLKTHSYTPTHVHGVAVPNQTTFLSFFYPSAMLLMIRVL